MAATMLADNPFSGCSTMAAHSSSLLMEQPATLDPSSILPPIRKFLTMPPNLRFVVESAFDEAFRGTMHEVRLKLLSTVQEMVEQQLSQALSQYTVQVAGSESAVMSAHRTILEECVAVNAKYQKLQGLMSQHTRESLRLQDAMAKVESERAQILKHKTSLDREKQDVKTERLRLQAEEAKVSVAVAEIREERQQVLQWHQLLSTMEQSLKEREVRADMQGGGLPTVAKGQHKHQHHPAQHAGGVYQHGIVPPACASLEEARRTIQEKGPMTEKYNQSKRAVRAPVPIGMYGMSESPARHSTFPVAPSGRSVSPRGRARAHTLESRSPSPHVKDTQV